MGYQGTKVKDLIRQMIQIDFRAAREQRNALRRAVRAARSAELHTAKKALLGTANAERSDRDALSLGRGLLHEM